MDVYKAKVAVCYEIRKNTQRKASENHVEFFNVQSGCRKRNR
jgi:hypothetical protein